MSRKIAANNMHSGCFTIQKRPLLESPATTVCQNSCQWHQWNDANVNLLQLKEDFSPVCEKRTGSDIFVRG